MIRSKGAAGSGDIVQAVTPPAPHHRRDPARLTPLGDEQLMTAAKDLAAPYDIVSFIHDNGRLPVPLFCAGGIATPADAALAMQLGAEAVFVGSGIFKSSDPATRAQPATRPPGPGRSA